MKLTTPTYDSSLIAVEQTRKITMWTIIAWIIGSLVTFAILTELYRKATLPYETYLKVIGERDWKDRMTIWEEVGQITGKRMSIAFNVSNLADMVDEGLLEEREATIHRHGYLYQTSLFKLSSNGRKKEEELKEKEVYEQEFQKA